MKFKKIVSILLVVCLLSICSLFSVSTVSAVSNPSTTKIKTVTQKSTTSLKIKWKKISNAKKYELYCKAGNGKFKRIATLGKNSNSYVHKNLKVGAKYFYKVRSYKVSNGKKYYSKFSNQVGGRTTNYLMSLTEPYSMDDCSLCNNGITMSMGGDNYTNGFQMSFCGSAIFNMKGKYKSITFSIGSIDDGSGNVSILSDDQCVWTCTVNRADLPKTFTVDIDYADKLEFKTEADRIVGYSIGFANIKVQ